MNLTYSQLPAKLKVSRFFLCLLFMKLINSSINGTGVNILLANLWCISNRPVTTGGISIPEMLIPLEDLAKVVKMLSRVDRFASFVEFPGPLGFSREVVWKCWCRNFCFFYSRLHRSSSQNSIFPYFASIAMMGESCRLRYCRLKTGQSANIIYKYMALTF